MTETKRFLDLVEKWQIGGPIVKWQFGDSIVKGRSTNTGEKKMTKEEQYLNALKKINESVQWAKNEISAANENCRFEKYAEVVKELLWQVELIIKPRLEQDSNKQKREQAILSLCDQIKELIGRTE
jgi:hypothetical protein